LYRRPVARVSANQRLQIIGKISRPWHRSTVEQNWDDSNLTTQRRGNLNAYEIFRIIQSPTALFIGDIHPMCSYDGNQDVAGTYAFFDCFKKKSTPGFTVSTSMKICFRSKCVTSRS
jgi:hypothetical protein